MSVMVVTVTTHATATTTATSTSLADASSTVSAGTIAGIIIGTLIGGILLVVLVLFLLNRCNRQKFTRVANPAHDRIFAFGAIPQIKSTTSRRSNYFTRHSHTPSTSTDPLMSPASWPPIPSTSRVHSTGTPPRSDSLFPAISSFDLGEFNRPSGSMPHPDIPLVRTSQQTSSESFRAGMGNTLPLVPQASGGSASPSTSLRSQQTLFLHRMLQSRAGASEGVSLSHHPSFDFLPSRTLTSSGIRPNEEELLAWAERTALQDAGRAQKEERQVVLEQEDGGGEGESTESAYSQNSAPFDHSTFFSDPVWRQKSSRKRARTPAPNELPSVAEIPDTLAVANSSLDARVSHGTTPSPGDPSASLPLLTSTNFGKDSTASGTLPRSVSSTAGSGSGSSGGASRYPSLAPSSIGQSSGSGSRSDGGTNWHHLPSGLAGLSKLQIEPLRNPHSPVEKQPELPEVLSVPRPTQSAPAQHAHLREGTISSIPEVERRSVIQGGIVHIDVSL